jgi:hypothetical protein
MLVFTMLANKHGRHLHGNGAATLTGAEVDKYGSKGPSIDRHLAESLCANDGFKSLVLGINPPGSTTGSPPTYSVDGPRMKVPAYNSPFQTFYAMFGQTPGPTVPDAKIAMQKQASVLDGVCDDYDAARKVLAGEERQKLESMFDACRDLEKRIIRRMALIDQYGRPKNLSVAVDSTKPNFETDLNFATAEAWKEVIVLAFQWRMTHVISFSVAADVGNWGFLNVNADWHRGVQHGGLSFPPGADKATKDARYDELRNAVFGWQTAFVADIYARLAKIPEAGGTMADQTLVQWMNEGGGRHHDGNDFHFAVLLGNPGNRLSTGKFMPLPWRKHPVNEYFLTVLRSMGLNDKVFGDPELCKNGPLPVV